MATTTTGWSIRPAPPPGEHAFTFVEIDVDESVSLTESASDLVRKTDEAGAILEYEPAPRVLQAIEVHRIDLLLRMDDREVCWSANSSPAKIMGCRGSHHGRRRRA